MVVSFSGLRFPHFEGTVFNEHIVKYFLKCGIQFLTLSVEHLSPNTEYALTKQK